MDITVKHTRADIDFRALKGIETLSSTDGNLVYAIGDIHGQAELLVPLVEDILGDIKDARHQKPIIIFLGDYIDRGPKSRTVVDIILRLSKLPFVRVISLCGNHEDMMLRFLQDPSQGMPWLAAGGADTLISYGLTAPELRSPPEVWEELRLALHAALPKEHLDFYNDLKMMVQIGNFAFVHAGVRPGVPLDLQNEDDLMWIRKPFLEAKRPSEKVIVHGHTPVLEPELFPHRICIDTGAYATGILTALKLYEGDIVVLQSKRNP